MNSKKNIPLIIGIAVPIFMILLVAISIYLPSLFAPAPRFNFLYVVGDGYGTNLQYIVENGKLIKQEVKEPQGYAPRAARLFVYNVSTGEDKEMSFEEAQKFNIDTKKVSADGYEVVYGSENYGFFPLFFGSDHDYNNTYLKGHSASKKLNLQSLSEGNYYYRNRRFLGWIR